MKIEELAEKIKLKHLHQTLTITELIQEGIRAGMRVIDKRLSVIINHKTLPKNEIFLLEVLQFEINNFLKSSTELPEVEV